MKLEKSLRDELHHAGYDLEEEYFHRVNAELIARLRAERLAKRISPVVYLRALPPPPSKFEKWMNVIFKPLPTGIYSFPV